MTVGEIKGPNLTGINAFDNPNALTGEGLLMYCQSQLNDIDGQVKSYMAQQKQAILLKEVLGQLKNTLAKYQPPKKENYPEILKAYQTAEVKLKELGQSDLAAQVNAEKNKLFPNSEAPKDPEKAMAWVAACESKGIEKVALEGNKMPGNKESWSGYVGEVDAMVSDINGNAELNMIQLQSLMSKRQTAVQLTTNMLAKHDQTIASILNNLK